MQAEAEFEPVRIVKLHGGGYGNEPQKDAWRYLLEWRRLPRGPKQAWQTQIMSLRWAV